jgi:hypothetical protein
MALNAIQNKLFKDARMDRKQFEQRVLASAGPDLRDTPALKTALFDAGREKEHFYEQDVREVLARARVISEGWMLPQDTPETVRGRARKTPGAEAYFISQEIVKALACQVALLREERFDSAAPPYTPSKPTLSARDVAISDAAAWIEAESQTDLKKWRGSRASTGDEIRVIRRLVKQAGYEGYSLSTSPDLPYFGPPHIDFQKSALTAPGTFLAKFARRISEWSKRTSIQPSLLTMHVLTGLVPLLSRVRFTENERHFELASGKQAHMRSVTLKFNTADLTFDELRKIYNDVREYLGGKGQKAPTFEDLEFWEFVESMGGPPKKEIRRFWIAVRDRWNAEHPGTQPLKSWEGFQDRYQRLARRLGLGPGPTSLGPD